MFSRQGYTMAEVRTNYMSNALFVSRKMNNIKNIFQKIITCIACINEGIDNIFIIHENMYI